jgi:hypothetical protein
MLSDASHHPLRHLAFARARRASATRRRLFWVVAVGLSLLATCGPLVGFASADNASSAAAFIENAQNQDGGFGAEHGQSSNPGSSLWATVALLAAGKNPQDEQLNNGASADDYLAAHLSDYRSLTFLGLLALVQTASGASASRYGDPGTQLTKDLTVPAVRSDPGGAALAILGLFAVNTGSARRAATDAARTLLAAPDSDGGWGSGSSDSASTALALEALAQSGVAGAGNATVKRGIAYLKHAQVNDGSIAVSDRTDPSSTGNPAATAFTIQALHALHIPTLRTSTGTTVVQGLASYQQQGTGGLSQFGAYDTGVAPSVTDTAQAYPAFDGVSFPLAFVASSTPVAPTQTSTAPKPSSAERVSAGSASSAAGISSNAPSGKKTVGAFKGASAAGSAKSKSGKAAAPGGTAVTGAVVGATHAPKLTASAGRKPAKDYTTLLLAGGLFACALLGAALDTRRPRRDPRSRVAVGVQAAASFLSAPRTRRALAPGAVLLVGVTLVAIPFVTQMWTRAPEGARMIRSFAPYMKVRRLDDLQRDVASIDAGIRQASARSPALLFPHAATATIAREQTAAADPELALFAKQWPAIHRRFVNVLDPIRANRRNYDAVAALPSLTLFPWMFVAPGAILILLAAAVLLLPRLWTKLRWGVAALGIGLVIAPLVLGMFARAPEGARLVSDFQSVETRARLTAIQDDFSSLAIGQGALGTELLPALNHRGLGRAKIDRALPAVVALDRRWVKILGDLTPVLGVLSDNISNYRAVAALPAFTLFPWLFAVPGLLAAGLVLLAGARRRLVLRHRTLATDSQARRILTPNEGAP